MANNNGKRFTKALVFGSLVFVLGFIIAGFIGNAGFLANTLIPALLGGSALTIGGALAFGIAAFLTEMILDRIKFFK